MADAVGNRFGVQIVRDGAAWTLIEPEQLRRFLTTFGVDCVFDVGANFGQYATRLRRIGFKELIVSFEPLPDAAAAIREQSRKNNDSRWIVKEVALDALSRTLSFNVMKSSEFSSLHEPDQSGTTRFCDTNSIDHRISLEARTLAQFFPELQSEYGFKRPFLKMDTQGHDVSVAQGAGPYMGEFVGLQSELAITTLYKGAQNYHEALDYYRSLGFKLSGLIPNNAGHFPELNEVDCLMYNPKFL